MQELTKFMWPSSASAQIPHHLWQIRSLARQQTHHHFAFIRSYLHLTRHARMPLTLMEKKKAYPGQEQTAPSKLFGHKINCASQHYASTWDKGETKAHLSQHPQRRAAEICSQITYKAEPNSFCNRAPSCDAERMKEPWQPCSPTQPAL